MSTFVERQARAFMDRFIREVIVYRNDTQASIDSKALRRLVRSEPDLTELVVRTYCAGGEAEPALLKTAALLAGAYQVEFQDDKLVRVAQRAAGGKPIEIGLSGTDGNVTYHDALPLHDDTLRILKIDAGLVERGDVTNIVRVFREVAEEPAGARKLQGKVGLEFGSYRDDPRPDFVISAIREYIRAIDAEFPYFAYYLWPEPDVGQVRVFLFSLLPETDFRLLPGSWRYNGSLDAILSMLLPRIRAIRAFGEEVGDDPERVAVEILQIFPDPVIRQVCGEMGWSTLR